MPFSSRLVIHPIRDVTVVNFNETSILDTAQVEQIGADLYELVDNKACRKIVLDFSKVRFLSSSALGVLITMKKKSAAIKGRMVLCGMRKDLKKVFQISGLEKMFDFCDREEQALETFGVTTMG